jgi:hypothetical protein
LCLLTEENDNLIIMRTHIVFTDGGCRCCRLSVNTICGRVMIGLSLSSVIKHNMWSLTEDNDNPIIMRTHIVLTDGRQQPNHNAITCCVCCRCCRPSVNTICGRIMIRLSLLSSVSKHKMWLCYEPNHNTTTYCVY